MVSSGLLLTGKHKNIFPEYFWWIFPKIPWDFHFYNKIIANVLWTALGKDFSSSKSAGDN